MREIIKGELDKPLTPEEREKLLGLAMETAHHESQKDSENKQFMERLFKGAAMVTVFAATSAVVVLGGKAAVQSTQTPRNQ